MVRVAGFGAGDKRRNEQPFIRILPYMGGPMIIILKDALFGAFSGNALTPFVGKKSQDVDS